MMIATGAALAATRSDRSCCYGKKNTISNKSSSTSTSEHDTSTHPSQRKLITSRVKYEMLKEHRRQTHQAPPPRFEDMVEKHQLTLDDDSPNVQGSYCVIL